MTRARTASSARASIRGMPTTGREPSAAPGTSGHERAPASAPLVPPYPASWFDWVLTRVDRLPGHYLLWYGVLGVLTFALITLGRLAAGLPAFGGDLGNRAFASFMMAFLPFLMHYLNRTAAASFSAFTPALQTPEEGPALRYRLTTAPAVPSLLFSLGAADFRLS